MIGTIFELKRSCLGNPPGTRGVVYEEYKDFDIHYQKGVSVIFKNGNYDGFSFNEQHTFLNRVDFSSKHSDYIFKGVYKLSNDYRAGYWNELF